MLEGHLFGYKGVCIDLQTMSYNLTNIGFFNEPSVPEGGLVHSLCLRGI